MNKPKIILTLTEINSDVSFSCVSSIHVLFPFFTISMKNYRDLFRCSIVASSQKCLFDRSLLLDTGKNDRGLILTFAELPKYHLFFNLTLFDSKNNEIEKHNFHWFFDSKIYKFPCFYIHNTTKFYCGNFLIDAESNQIFELDRKIRGSSVQIINGYYFINSFSIESIYKFTEENNKLIYVDSIPYDGNESFFYIGSEKYTVNENEQTIRKGDFELKIDKPFRDSSEELWIDENNVSYILFQTFGDGVLTTIYIISLNLDFIVELCGCSMVNKIPRILNDNYLEIYGILSQNYMKEYCTSSFIESIDPEKDSNYLLRSLTNIRKCDKTRKKDIVFYNQMGKVKSYSCINKPFKEFHPSGRSKVWFLCSLLFR